MGEVGDLVSVYDDVCRSEALLHDGLEAEFLKFVRSQQQYKLDCMQAKEELEILKQEHEITIQEVGHWRTNFEDLRNALKSEETRRKEAERILSDFVRMFEEIKEVVNQDNSLTDQTKERFTMLRNYEQLYPRTESESAEQNLDFDKSGEVLDFEPTVQVPSPSKKRTSSANRNLGLELPVHKQLKCSESELFVTTTSVAVPSFMKSSTPHFHKLDLMRQESVPVTPPLLPPEGIQNLKRRSRSEPEPIILDEEEQFQPPSEVDFNENQILPPRILLSAVEQESPDVVFKSATPRMLNTSRLPNRHTSNSGSKLSRPHELAAKTVFKPEICVPCGRKIKFSKQALRCHNCHLTCHPECKSSIPLPCISVDRTPNKVGKTVSDFAPADPPRVPSILVLCVSEVEARGKNEAGLYRLSAPEREISAVKEKFFKSKGWPNLKNVNVHLLCATIKDFLRNLEPLIPKLIWKEFASAAAILDLNDSQTALYQCIGQLPLPNRDTLAFLILHWLRVSENPNIKMPVKNLAMVLGPTVVGFSSQSPDPETMLAEQQVQVKVMEKLLLLPAEFWNTFITEQTNSPIFQDTSSSSIRSTLLGTSLTSNLHRGRAVRGNPNTRPARLFTSPNP